MRIHMPDYADMNCKIIWENGWYNVYYKGKVIGYKRFLKDAQNYYNKYIDGLKK